MPDAQVTDPEMNKLTLFLILFVTLVCSARIGAAQPVTEPNTQFTQTTSEIFLLGPPKDDGPVIVRASFEFHDISAINDEEESFQFTGVLTLKWRDKRQAFDPVAAGVDEKFYQGSYQFNELSPSWFPQVVLVNGISPYESHGVALRVQPDGSQTLIEEISAVARTEFNFLLFPMDRQNLRAVFEILGFDKDEVVLEADSESNRSITEPISIPQWTIIGVGTSTQERPTLYGRRQGLVSEFVANVEVQRNSYYVRRLVSFPLIAIVLLSFSVFWMEKSSLGDRMSVSFIGILAAVAYQIVMSEMLPRIAYVTLMNAFLNLSFLTMVATVAINLVVGQLDAQGKFELADRVDRRCRWIFPLTYIGLTLILYGTALLMI
jgi:hypothetical protein